MGNVKNISCNEPAAKQCSKGLCNAIRTSTCLSPTYKKQENM